MSTYSKLRELRSKYEKELIERNENGEQGDTIDLLERVIKDITEVETYASWDEFPEVMGR